MNNPAFLYPSPGLVNIYGVDTSLVLRHSRKLGLITYIEIYLSNLAMFCASPRQVSFPEFKQMLGKKLIILTVLKRRDYSLMEIDSMFRQALYQLDRQLTASSLSNANKWHLHDAATYEAEKMKRYIHTFYVD